MPRLPQITKVKAQPAQQKLQERGQYIAIDF